MRAKEPKLKLASMSGATPGLARLAAKEKSISSSESAVPLWSPANGFTSLGGRAAKKAGSTSYRYSTSSTYISSPFSQLLGEELLNPAKEVTIHWKQQTKNMLSSNPPWGPRLCEIAQSQKVAFLIIKLGIPVTFEQQIPSCHEWSLHCLSGHLSVTIVC